MRRKQWEGCTKRAAILYVENTHPVAEVLIVEPYPPLSLGKINLLGLSARWNTSFRFHSIFAHQASKIFLKETIVLLSSGSLRCWRSCEKSENSISGAKSWKWCHIGHVQKKRKKKEEKNGGWREGRERCSDWFPLPLKCLLFSILVVSTLTLKK